MFSGDVFYYWPLNSVDKIISKTSFFFALSTALCTNSRVWISRWQKSELSVFQAKNMQVLTVFFISNNYYIYLKRYFEIFLLMIFLIYSEDQLLQTNGYINNKQYNVLLSNRLRYLFYGEWIEHRTQKLKSRS